jgi:hypothetical protein
LIAVGGVIYYPNRVVPSDPALGSTMREPTITVKAEDILREYVGNEIAADQKYKTRRVRVTGVVREAGKDVLDHAYVVLGTTDAIRGVQCMLLPEAIAGAGRLRKGDEIRVEGVVSRLMVNILISECSLVLERVSDASPAIQSPASGDDQVLAPLKSVFTNAEQVSRTANEPEEEKTLVGALQCMAPRMDNGDRLPICNIGETGFDFERDKPVGIAILSGCDPQGEIPLSGSSERPCAVQAVVRGKSILRVLAATTMGK